MAGQLDSLLKNVAKQVVVSTWRLIRFNYYLYKKGISSYNTSTGAVSTTDTSLQYKCSC